VVENDLDVAAGLDEDAWQLVSERVRQLEASWRDGRNPDFAELVPATGHPGRLRVLVELIKVDQEMRWKSGQ